MGKHNSKKWAEYYNLQLDNEGVDPLVKKGLAVLSNSKISRTGLATDLGCGKGVDTIGLLKVGFSVTAIDAQTQAINLLLKSAPAKLKKKLKTNVSIFEILKRDDFSSVDIFIAIYSLFFCRPSSFDYLWTMIQESIVSGGVFCGHFIGKKDSWASKRGITSVNKVKLKQMLKNFEIISFKEEENDNGTITGKPKHWHVFSIVAKKK